MRADVGSEYITRKLLEQVESRDSKTKLNCTYKTPSLGKCKIINDSIDYETFCKLVNFFAIRFILSLIL